MPSGDRAEIAATSDAQSCFVGSLARRLLRDAGSPRSTACSAVLLNPAIDPHVGLRAYLGAQKNLHTGEPYELTEAHLRDWERH